MTEQKIKLLFDESFDQERGLIACLEEIGGIPDVKQIVGMVDLHLKRNTENPSSVAIATDQTLIPKLSSVAQNCGMALTRTNLSRADVTEDNLDRFFGLMRAEDDQIMRRPEISMEDIRQAVCFGATSVIDRYGLTAQALDNIEFRGVIGEPELLPWKTLNRLVPRFSLDRGRYGFGVIPAGNHFLEIQYIDQIIDAEACRHYGLCEGGVTIMIHSDGGLISDDIGNLYGNRTTSVGLIKMIYTLRKALLHLRDWKGPGNWQEKRQYYFGRDKYIQISPDTYEGRRFLEAKRLSMNAGYASRLSTIGRIKNLLARTFSSKATELELLCDFSHNSIFQETIQNQPMWIHRHNACRVTPGQLVFLPGYCNTSSYVCLGDSGAENFLNTMDHGAGKTIDRFKKKDLCRQLENGSVTRSYSNQAPEPKLVPHWSDEGIDKVIEVLTHNRIIKPIARLKPMAGYRYIWKGRLARAREKMTTG